MENVSENELFFTGILVGVNLYQQIVLTAYDRMEPLNIDGRSFYIRSSEERLQEMLEQICK